MRQFSSSKIRSQRHKADVLRWNILNIKNTIPRTVDLVMEICCEILINGNGMDWVARHENVFAEKNTNYPPTALWRWQTYLISQKCKRNSMAKVHLIWSQSIPESRLKWVFISIEIKTKIALSRQSTHHETIVNGSGRCLQNHIVRMRWFTVQPRYKILSQRHQNLLE